MNEVEDTVAEPPSAEPESLKPSDRIGRYVIERLVGAGAMGQVYAARDPALDRTVALKLLRRGATAPELEMRLLREAKAMARISHPHVIAVHDAGRHGDQVYIAMEFITGGTLRDWLGAGRRSWREVLDLFIRAGRGLAEAHAAGVIHRDFKPDNVLVSEDASVVRVTDFGLARGTQTGTDGPLEEAETLLDAAGSGSLDSALTRTGVIVGTPVYMAPEQHAAEAADARSDVYGFSVALYEALYGERPFMASTLTALHATKLAEKVQPAKAGSLVPPRLRKALLRGLRADPAKRPQSMNELLAELVAATRQSRGPVAAAAAIGVLGATGALYGAGAHRATTARAPAASASAAVAECSTHGQCAEKHGGEPWRCRAADHTCVAVATEGCKPYFEPEDLQSEETVWLGALLPHTGSLAAVGESNLNAALLARKEFARATRALSDGDASVHVPPIALAACDDAEPDKARRAAEHLVSDVGVPAILGFRSGQEVMDLAGSLLVQRHVLSVATLSSNPLITQIPQPADLPRMVWRTTDSMLDIATAAAGFIEKYFARRGGPARLAPRVVVLRSDGPTDIASGQALMKVLVFGEKMRKESDDRYLELALPAGGEGGALKEAVIRLAQRVVDAVPAFLVLLESTSSVSVVRTIEERWPPGVARPIYLLLTDAPAQFADAIGGTTERRRRIFGVLSMSNSAASGRFVTRYNGAFANHVVLAENPGTTYDAFYMLALGAAALGDDPVNGISLARSFARLLPPAPRFEVGPEHLVDALSRLTRGDRIDLEGTNTSFDLDLTTGETSFNYTLLCPAEDPAGRVRRESVESGLILRAGTRELEGASRCP